MAFDHNDDIQIIEGFVGNVCERTLACNSLKLRFSHKKSYIWLDPPWTLYRSDIEIASPDDCPEQSDAFQQWSDALNPLNRVIFTVYEYTEHGDLKLIFDNDLSLHIPSSDEPFDEEDFYSHWYASSGGNS